MAYYLQSTNAYTTCDTSTPFDLGASVGSGTATSGSWSFASYSEVATFDILVSSGMSASNDITVNLSVNSLTSGLQYRFRLQQINPSGCAVLNSSSYSSDYTSTGTISTSLTLAWTGSSGILRLSVELYNNSAPPFPPPVIVFNCNSSSYLDIFVSALVERRMYTVRDHWWMAPSGGTYLLNSNGSVASKNVGLYRQIENTLGGGDSTYIQNGTQTGGTYHFRVTNDPVVPQSVRLKSRGKIGSAGSGTLTMDLYINGAILPNIASFTDNSTPQNVDTTVTLNDYQRKAILNGRTNQHYDFCSLTFSAGGSAVIQHARIYDFELYYGNNNYNEYITYNTSNPGANVFSVFPDVVEPQNCNWQTDAGVTFASGDTVLVRQYASGADADARYIRCAHEPYLATFNVLPSAEASIANSYSLPSGNLTLHFNVGSAIPDYGRINRAYLYLRMSLPPSGFYSSSGNMRDCFEVHGKNPSIYSGGNIIWGKGSIVEQSGFQTYTTELSWLKPDLYSSVPLSGNISHPYYQVAESLRGVQLQILGIPSGAYLSAAELRVETPYTTSMNMYIAGKTTHSGVQNLYTLNEALVGPSSGINHLYIGSSSGINNTFYTFVHGHTSYSGTQNLFTTGGVKGSGDLPLYIGGRIFPSATKTQNLFIYSTTNSGQMNTLALFTNSFYDPSQNLPLYISGYDVAQNNTLPLIIGGVAEGSTASIPLYLHNVYASASKTLRMFVQNNGTSSSGVLPLYISRSSEGTSVSLPMFLKVIDGNPSSGNMNLFIKSLYSLPMNFEAIGDSYIDSTNTSTNYGSNQYLKVTQG